MSSVNLLQGFNLQSLANRSLTNSLLTQISSLQALNQQSRQASAADVILASKYAANSASYSVAASNTQFGMDLANTALATTTTISAALTEIETLAVSAQNGALSTGERTAIGQQILEQAETINSLVNTTSYNSYTLLDGSTSSLHIQFGIEAGSTTEISLPDLSVDELGSGSDTIQTKILDLSAAEVVATTETATELEALIESAQSQVSTASASVNAQYSTLSSLNSLAQRTSTSYASANQRLVDADDAYNLASAINQELASLEHVFIKSFALQLQSQLLSTLS